MSDIQRAHAIVWQYRERLADVWKLPDVRDSLRFAVCESCEALDAYLRTKPEYSRNNDKDLSIENELADCAMMLLTALGPDYEWGPSVWRADMESDNIDMIVGRCARALEAYYGALESWTHQARVTLSLIQAYPGMDLPARVEARLKRIERRVMGGDA